MKRLIYKNLVSEIQEINTRKDIQKAMAIYSDEFFKNTEKALVEKNIQALFENYSRIDYNPSKEKVLVNKNKALIENRVKYFAQAANKSVESISYQGKERIYLERYKNKWKIVAWIFEEENI